jgi:cystathionine beta-lyase
MINESAPGFFEADTLLAHDPDFPDGAVVPPIFQSSLFTFPNYEAMRAAFSGAVKHPVYSRVGNPTTEVFQAKMAALEGAEAARGFASGMAAISGAILSVVKTGDRLVCVRHVYPDAHRFFEVLLPRLGVTVEYVDGTNLEAVARALPGARLLYLESPTSWVFETQDLQAVADLARANGVVTVADNSWATPVFQNPLAHGVDLVLHSASKYLSGHSDTVAGVVCGRRELLDTMARTVVPYLGAKLAPFEAWLLVRGLRTLAVRMRAQEERGLAVARWLAAHRRVEEVLHPALQGRVDGRQLRGSSSLFSVKLDGAIDVRQFCDALRLFRLGVSWGGHESLVVPAAVALEQAAGPNSVRDFGVGPHVVRLHVGLERPEDLIADLEAALVAAEG